MVTATAQKPIQISVVIPVYNGGRAFRDCLTAVFASSLRDFEVIVVDDRSDDDSVAIARSFPCRIIELYERSGPGHARNEGAARASAGILFFLDADTIVRPDTFEAILRTFAEEPEIDALFGSFGKETVPRNFVSTYKNLLHHFTHQTSNTEAVTFCSGFGAVRRDVFFGVAGFDGSRKFLEDIELGHRMHLRGHRIRLVKSLQLTHAKKYSLMGLVRSDVVGRAIPWTRLMLETGVAKTDLNLKKQNIVSVPLSYAILFSAFLTRGAERWSVPGTLVALFLLLNLRFLRFLAQERGLFFAARGAVLCWFGYLYSAVGVAIGSVSHARSRRSATFAASDSVET